jgi:hypothetical protein
MPAAANHYAGKNLDTFFVAFDYFRVDPNRIAHREHRGFFAKLFRLDFI